MCNCSQKNIPVTKYTLDIVHSIRNFLDTQRKSFIKNGEFTASIEGLGENPSGFYTHLYRGNDVVFMSLVGARPDRRQFRMYIILYKLLKNNGEELLESLIINDMGILLDDIEIIDERRTEPLFFEGYSVINESELEKVGSE